MKRFYILFLGESSQNHLRAESKIALEFRELFHGFEILPYNGQENYVEKITERINYLKSINVEPIIMKGFNIHTEDYIRPLIQYCKNEYPDQKFFLSHCAVFDDFILTDGALLTKYTENNIRLVIMNAIELRERLKIYSYSKNIAMLNAGGDTNYNTAPEYWVKIYENLPKETDLYTLEMSQLDVAIDETIRIQKTKDCSDLPTIIIPSCINEANSIWKTLTVVAHKSLAGIVMGAPLYIGLTSRTDSEESIYKTIETLVKLLYSEQEIQ